MKYFDHAATTPVHPLVAEEMQKWLTDGYFNASSLYQGGRMARAAVEEAREKVRELIGAQTGSLIFTSGGTESDNTAIIGCALKNRGKRKAVAVSAIEHHAVLESCEFLKQLGFEARILPVDGCGRIDMAEYKRLVDEDVLLVSVMWANNEIGTIQDIPELARIAHEKGAFFHTDAVQALPYISLDVKSCGADMVSVSAHKICGPKGCGALWVKDPAIIQPFMHGGQQEDRLRGGTENVAAIAGFGKAAEILAKTREENAEGARQRRQFVFEQMKKAGARINTPMECSVPGILNIAFKDVEAEGVLFFLNMEGFCVSIGSACNSKSVEPSHVVRAIGIPEEYARGCLRISFGCGQTMEDTAALTEAVLRIAAQQRG